MTADAVEPLIWGATPGKALVRCVLVHGRGQTPEDMLEQIAARADLPEVSWVMPRAAGKSWYAARAVDPLTPQTQDELGAAMAQVSRLVQDLGVTRPLLLAGFSQGACLSLELVLRGQIMPKALVAFTGCRVGSQRCDRPSVALTGLPVYLSGSDADPWIPVDAFADAAGALVSAGAMLHAESHPGRAHEVNATEIAVLRKMLADIAEA